MVSKQEAKSAGGATSRAEDGDDGPAEGLDAELNKGQEPGSPGIEPPFEERTSPELLNVVQLPVRVELGRRQLPLKDALQLTTGSVVDLEKLAEEPVDLYINDLLFARGEVLVVDDCFCVRVTEINPRAKTMGSDS